jgi:hypothetical protein
MYQLEAIPSLKGSDVQGFERFADLVRITVVGKDVKPPCALCEGNHSIQLFELGLSPSKAEKLNTSAKECWESLINSLIF